MTACLVLIEETLFVAFSVFVKSGKCKVMVMLVPELDGALCDHFGSRVRSGDTLTAHPVIDLVDLSRWCRPTALGSSIRPSIP